MAYSDELKMTLFITITFGLLMIGFMVLFAGINSPTNSTYNLSGIQLNTTSNTTSYQPDATNTSCDQAALTYLHIRQTHLTDIYQEPLLSKKQKELSEKISEIENRCTQ